MQNFSKIIHANKEQEEKCFFQDFSSLIIYENFKFCGRFYFRYNFFRICFNNFLEGDQRCFLLCCIFSWWCFSYLEILCWEIFLVNLPILSYKTFCLPLSCTCYFLKLLFCFDWINQFYFLRVCVLLCVCIFIGSHLIFWIPELHLITMVILVQSLISSVW